MCNGENCKCPFNLRFTMRYFREAFYLSHSYIPKPLQICAWHSFCHLCIGQDPGKFQHQLRFFWLMNGLLPDECLRLPEPLLHVFALGEDVRMGPVRLS